MASGVVLRVHVSHIVLCHWALTEKSKHYSYFASQYIWRDVHFVVPIFPLMECVARVHR